MPSGRTLTLGEKGVSTDADLSAAFPLACGLGDLCTPGLVHTEGLTAQPLGGGQGRAPRRVICDPHACVALNIAHAMRRIRSLLQLGLARVHGTHTSSHTFHHSTQPVGISNGLGKGRPRHRGDMQTTTHMAHVVFLSSVGWDHPSDDKTPNPVLWSFDVRSQPKLTSIPPQKRRRIACRMRCSVPARGVLRPCIFTSRCAARRAQRGTVRLPPRQAGAGTCAGSPGA